MTNSFGMIDQLNSLMKALESGGHGKSNAKRFKEELSKPIPKKPVAHCDSRSCAKNAEYGYRKVVKQVPRSQTFCPDCGNALFWSVK